MKDLQREILSQVATGQITAAEGAARLESLGPKALPTAVAERSAVPPYEPGQGTRQVRLNLLFGSAEVVGDPSVAFVVAEGPHVARQEGDTMVIEQSPLRGDGSFSFGSDRRVLINGFDGHRRGLTVRMNPDLALFAKVQAGDVRIEGVHGPVSGEVQAGNCTIRDFRSPLNMLVQAGELDARGRLDSGASKLRCQMGDVNVRLEKGSSVRITARSTMGDIEIHGDNIGRSGDVVTIGSGAATLECECSMGSLKVIAD